MTAIEILNKHLPDYKDIESETWVGKQILEAMKEIASDAFDAGLHWERWKEIPKTEYLDKVFNQ